MLDRAGWIGLVACGLLACSAEDPRSPAGPIGPTEAGLVADAGTFVSEAQVPPGAANDANVPSNPAVDARGTLDELSKCGAVMQMAENKRQPVDIIIGVDTTSSMIEEIGFTEQNMNAFSQQISSAGIDVRVLLLSGPKDGMPPFPVHVDGVCIGPPLGSGSCPGDTKLPGYFHVVKPLANWDMLQNYVDLYPLYKPHLRPDSVKSFVSISDGNIGGAIGILYPTPIDDAEKFIRAVKALEPGSTMWRSWRYSAIYAYSACGIGNEIGTVHGDLVKATSGIQGDLCLQNFKPVFDDLAKQVVDVAALACDWEIPPVPMGKSFDAAKTNVQLTLDAKLEALGFARSAAECGAREGWHYDSASAPKRVVACPATCTRIQTARKAQVDLVFGCDTVVLL